jgi:polysaccharide export outer membrane protein
MKKRQLIFLFSLIILVSGCAMPRPKVVTTKSGWPFPSVTKFEMPEPTDYRIGLDDILEVNIWKHPDLSKEVTVRPDGKISYLLIGDVQAAGVTVAELDRVITAKFEKYAKKLQEKEGAEGPPIQEEYRIGVGDELNISVWRIPDLSIHASVRPDGKISYPLIGDVLAYGMTAEELDAEITERLEEYVKYPQVSVMIMRFGKVEGKRIAFVTDFISTFLEEKPEISILVKTFGSRKIIVLGQVGSPGIYDLKGNSRLLEAIGSAGGFKTDAVKDNIFVIRGNIYANPTVIKVNAWDIIKRGNYAMNIPLQDKDIIYAPRSIVGNWNVLIGQVSPTIDILNDSITLKDALQATLKMAD